MWLLRYCKGIHSLYLGHISLSYFPPQMCLIASMLGLNQRGTSDSVTWLVIDSKEQVDA